MTTTHWFISTRNRCGFYGHAGLTFVANILCQTPLFSELLTRHKLHVYTQLAIRSLRLFCSFLKQPPPRSTERIFKD